MPNIIENLLILLFFGILLILGINTNAIISNTALNNCIKNQTGEWENCSLSDQQAEYLTQAQTLTAKQYEILTPFSWIILLGVFVAAIYFLMNATH